MAAHASNFRFEPDAQVSQSERVPVAASVASGALMAKRQGRPWRQGLDATSRVLKIKSPFLPEK